MSFDGGRDYLDLFVQLHSDRGRDEGSEVEQGEVECASKGERDHEV